MIDETSSLWIKAENIIEELQYIAEQKNLPIEQQEHSFTSLGLKKAYPKKDFLVEDSMDKLVQWVLAKGLTKDPDEAESIAFAIANSNKDKKKQSQVESQKNTLQEQGESYKKSQEDKWQESWNQIGESFTKSRAKLKELSSKPESKAEYENLSQKYKESYGMPYIGKKAKSETNPLGAGRKKKRGLKADLELVGTIEDTTIKTHETENYIRKRQFDPSECEEGTFRTFRIGKGKKAVGCKVKGKFKAQSILEPKTTDYVDYVPLSSFKQVKHDFQEDFTMLHGNIARDGSYDYYDSKGNKITLIKKWDNLKEYYGKYDYLPLRGSADKGAHTAQELGFAYNFYPNPETHMIEADLVLVNNLPELTTLLDPKEGYHVSPGYEDKIIDNNIQLITKLDHVAISLGNKDTARACTGTNEQGYSCTTVFAKPIHDQNLKEVVN